MDQVADPAHDFKVVGSKRKCFDVAENESKAELRFESDGIEAAGRVMAAYENRNGGGILTASQIESEKSVEGERRHAQRAQIGCPPLSGSYSASNEFCSSSCEKT